MSTSPTSSSPYTCKGNFVVVFRIVSDFANFEYFNDHLDDDQDFFANLLPDTYLKKSDMTVLKEECMVF